MPRSPLSPHQRAVRRLLVKSKGNITRKEICEELGLGRTTVWRAIRAISQIRPIEDTDAFEEAREIKEAVEWYDTMEETLLDELESNEDHLGASAESGVVVGFMNIRLGLLNQVRTTRQDRQKFLQEIGMIRKVPEELLLRRKGLEDMNDEELDERIAATRKRIAELEGWDADEPQGGDLTAGDGTLPLPAEEDDPVQGA